MTGTMRLQHLLFAVVSLAALSLQASKDPLNDFCRRWGHQTAQIDGKLYIDGGLVAWNPISSNPLNYTNTWLLYSDLNSSATDSGMPIQHADLTKNSTVPSVSGGILWSDSVNKAAYLFGGEYQNNPADFSFWAYDVVLNQWNETKYSSNVDTLQRVAYGAGTQVEELGMGYYYGGWMNSNTSPGWAGLPMATSNLITFDMTSGTLNNNTGPDDVGRAEGQMVYLPASDGGLLAYFGGVEDPYQNGSFVAANMTQIHLFDISSSKWYTQTASGQIPESRRQFCAGATWADDHSSYNIYLYGGYGVDNVTGFDDVYILSLPSFTWIKAFPAENSTASSYPHGGCSANVINRSQMLVIGGWFTSSDVCDTANGKGQHNMHLGYNGPARSLWDKYDPKVSAYSVPTPIISVIGGGPTGGATATKPSNWNDPDLAVYFTRVPSFAARAATRTIPSGTSKPSSTGKSSTTNVKAIAGGVVGGLAVLIAILCLILFCLHRRKKATKNKKVEQPPPPPPAELPATSPVHEMPSPSTRKYMPVSQQADYGHSRSASHDYLHTPTSPYPPQSYQTPSAPTTPYMGEFPDQSSYQQQPAYIARYSAPEGPPPDRSPHYAYAAPSTPPRLSPQQLQQRFYEQNVASQHSRSHSHSHSQSSQQYQQPPQQQIYFPPPPDPSTTMTDRMGSTEGTSYSGEIEHMSPPSTTNTPAQFYAQPMPTRPAEYSREVVYGNAGDSDSVDNRRRERPVRGRFVEVDHM